MELTGIEFILTIEEAFGVSISDEEARKFVTVGDLYECIMRKRAAVIAPEGSASWVPVTRYDREVWNTLRSVFVRQYHIPYESVKADAKLARDFGIE